MKNIKYLPFILSAVSIFTFCKKKETPQPEPQPSHYSVRMTDAPAAYSAVNIDLQGVEITSNGNATMLNVNPGIYNLLNFANGVDTLIATADLYVDKIQQIRLILGPNNTVVKNGVTYTLSTPSADQSGLKLQVHQDLQSGVAYYILLDFDANQSIVDEGNGSYKLKPVIRTIDAAISGAIQGKLSVPGVPATITAANSTYSCSSIPNAAGDFIIKGVPAGSYSVTIVPAAPHNSVSINNVNVTTGVTTTLGVISI